MEMLSLILYRLVFVKKQKVAPNVLVLYQNSHEGNRQGLEKWAVLYKTRVVHSSQPFFSVP